VIPTAVITSCHGAVDRKEDIPAFLAKIRRGRPTPHEIVHEVTHRFEAVGGSPLMRVAKAQSEALAARIGLPVAPCGRLWKPSPDDVVRVLVEAGVKRIVSLPLAPQSMHIYHASIKEAVAALGEGGPEVRYAESYGLHAGVLDAWDELIAGSLAKLSKPSGAMVLLSAHSLPMRALAAGDPYEREYRAMANAIAERVAARGAEARVVFQSKGMDGGDWLGPDLTDVLRELSAEGRKEVVVAPTGFVADHIETLYDLDIEARSLAESLGFERFERTPALGAHPRFVDALEAAARAALS
jgi:ferrochelatase